MAENKKDCWKHKFEYTLDAPNEEADKKLLFLIKELGITEEDIEAVGDV